MESQFITQNHTAFIGDKTYPPRYVSLILGNPRSEECAGFGICRFDEEWPLPGQMPPPPEPTPSPKPSKPKRPKSVSDCLSGCCSGVAMVERLETTEGKVSLSFSFLKSSLTPETVKKHFGATHFRVGSDVSLPPTLTKAFDLDLPKENRDKLSVFGAGLYQIAETRDYFQIRLQIN